MIRRPRPDALRGDQLAEELRAAGINVSDFDVTVVGDSLEINVVDVHWQTVDEVIANHRPKPVVDTKGDRMRSLRAKQNWTPQDRDEVLRLLLDTAVG